MSIGIKEGVVMRTNHITAMVLLFLSVCFGGTTTSIAAASDHKEVLLRLQTKADECRKAGRKRCLIACNRAMQEGKRNNSSEKFAALSRECNLLHASLPKS